MLENRRADVTVLICTYNRSARLRQTLASLGRMSVDSHIAWEVLVVDNNCTDDTPQVVADAARTFPVPLHYACETQPGRSAAFNHGLTVSRAPVIASTDDDVEVCAEWLSAACGPLLDPAQHVDYTGGPVAPIWEAPPPAWFPLERANLWGTIAILDYGPEPFVFEDRRRVPIGANVAFRRDLFDRVGPLVTTLGRSKTGTILGQELPELFRRTRDTPARGLYVPAMRVFHHVPAQRLTRRYFLRWWFGKGVCRARIDRLHPVTELGLDLRTAPRLCGVPRFMIADAARDGVRWVRAVVAGAVQDRVMCEMRWAFLAGYLWEHCSSCLHRGMSHAAAAARRIQTSLRGGLASVVSTADVVKKLR